MRFSPALALPKPFDPAAAKRGRERWLEQAGVVGEGAGDAALKAWSQAFLALPEGRALIDSITGNSPFLGHILTRESAFARQIVEDGLERAFAGVLSGLERDFAGATQTATLMRGLRLAKRKAALAIALGDISGLWPLERVTGALSDVAETALRLACRHLLRDAARSGALIPPDLANSETVDPCVGSGLIVLGMGKLGARELNYSSDIDLIVLYDDTVARAPQPDRLARAFIRLARDLVRIMEERTVDGYVFRTDLRLRPDPGATPLAVSLSAAEIYYDSLGQNWERAAMIKARALAGDPNGAEVMRAVLEPFVWRRHLDFATIQDIHAIKRQINAHKGHREVTVNGHDVKLGRGGIREIEFFAQTQQLIFGGRDSRLRIRQTLPALEALRAAGKVTRQGVDELSDAYRFLRRVEHRIQMIDDRQTHRVPDDDQGVAHLAKFLGYDDPADFRAELLAHLGRVEDRYAELFEESPTLAGPGNLVFTGTDDDPATLATLAGMGFFDPARVIAVVGVWHRGRYRATRSDRARALLTELVPGILKALAQTARPDEALIGFDTFLARLPAGVQIFSLFQANPALLDLVAEIMGTAPRLAQALAHVPALLDSVVGSDFFAPLPDRAGLAAENARVMADARDFEDSLTRARAWTNDQRFRAGVHILRDITNAEGCGPFLADLADIVVSDLATRVALDFQRRHGVIEGADWVMVAMGKLGGRQLTITSDIDLIVIYQAPANAVSNGAKALSGSEYFIKLTQRLTNAITAPMADGRLYEVDMRLRPSGHAGPLATSLDAFVKYQAENAWTWERMALTRARPLGPATPFTSRVADAVRHALTRPRDQGALLRDVADMRRRIDKEFGTGNPWDLKYTRGGLIDIEFIAQYLQLRHAAEHPEILATNTAAALARAMAAGLLGPRTATELTASLSLWRRAQGYLRVTTDGVPSPDEVAGPLAAGLAKALGVDAATLDQTVRASQARVHHHFRTLIEEPAGL